MDDTELQSLFRAREARALAWSFTARLAFCIVGVAVTLLNQTHDEGVATISLAVIGLGLMAHSLRSIREHRNLVRVGWTVAAFDGIVLCALPLIWYLSVGGSSAPPAFLLKSNLPSVAFVMIAFNSMALRPQYPLFITGVAVALLLGTGFYASLDPRLVWTEDNLRGLLSEEVKGGFFAWRVASVALTGGFMTMLARWARQTMKDVVQLEATNRHMISTEASRLINAKTDAVSSLVAGIAHELNSPLGALQASTQTNARAVERVSSSLDSAKDIEALRQDEQLQRAVRALRQGMSTTEQAMARVKALITSLKNFTKLDEEELQELDLRDGLDSSLSLIGDDIKGAVEVKREYAELPTITCRAKLLNQVFYTILKNAFEAMNGSGVLLLEARGVENRLRVCIRDTGKGMDEAKLAQLFDLGFSVKAFNVKQGRASMGLGLPLARSIVEGHGGKLWAESQPDAGSAFHLELPLPA